MRRRKIRRFDLEKLEARVLLSAVATEAGVDEPEVNPGYVRWADMLETGGRPDQDDHFILKVTPDGESVEVILNGNLLGTFLQDDLGMIEIRMLGGNDLVVIDETNGLVRPELHIEGGLGDDTLYGSSSLDWLHGEAGNDVLYGGGGDDWIVGNQGSDLLFGGDGDDRMYGDERFRESESVYDLLVGGAGVDELRPDEADEQYADEISEPEPVPPAEPPAETPSEPPVEVPVDEEEEEEPVEVPVVDEESEVIDVPVVITTVDDGPIETADDGVLLHFQPAASGHSWFGNQSTSDDADESEEETDLLTAAADPLQ